MTYVTICNHNFLRAFILSSLANGGSSMILWPLLTAVSYSNTYDPSKTVSPNDFEVITALTNQSIKKMFDLICKCKRVDLQKKL